MCTLSSGVFIALLVERGIDRVDERTPPMHPFNRERFQMNIEVSTFGIATAVVAGTIAAALLAARRKSRHECSSSKKADSWEAHVTDHGPMREVWPGCLYVLEAPGCSMGPPVRNMTIYRVPDGSRRLVIYNGIAVDETSVAAIEKLGTPSILVIPNALHRCCASVWKNKYPEIVIVCPEIAQEKASEVVEVDMTMHAWATKDEWSKWIHTKEIDGWCEFETVVEVELDAKANGKRAMLVCDLLFTLAFVDNATYASRLIAWFFDCSITLPSEGSIVVPKISRIARLFGIKDWAKAEAWYRSYAQKHGTSIGAILVGHGVPVVQVDAADGCTKALDGIADQLIHPRW